MLEPHQAEGLWEEDNQSVFYVVGTPLTLDEIDARKRLKREKETAVERQKEREEAEAKRERALLDKHRAWAREEEARLQLEAEGVRVRAHQRSAGVCTRVTTTLARFRDSVTAGPPSIGLLGDVFSVCVFFVTSFVRPSLPSEEEKLELDGARERERDEAEQRAGRRGYGRLEHRSPFNASSGG
jgi:hypothetical protein